MPELPEVETVRRGLAQHVVGRTIATVQVSHPRAVRRHLPGPADFAAQVQGATLQAVNRRGKYLWFEVLSGYSCSPLAVVAHLGMSGQLLLLDPTTPAGPHLRCCFGFTDGGPELRFVDQRTFGGMYVDELAATYIPTSLAHIARDPLDEQFDLAATCAAIRVRRTGIKKVLLDQNVISGIGNIYADEALWYARLHYDYPANRLRPHRIRQVVEAARTVMCESLARGGTSFDSLYIDVNGASGTNSPHLVAYGREGLPCHRCGRPLVREPWQNRSSYRCPRCQPRPRGT